ncbi:hypothetical protein [uncultured Lamprocystis sp.]|uniref:hypothetical protein n=1 Tax=uncultured Lamprocystis sp. TaxID=543132 RepID=UPI0025FE2025|nr:hypothetical protein [uncultured Lamprocystis sp.]
MDKRSASTIGLAADMSPAGATHIWHCCPGACSGVSPSIVDARFHRSHPGAGAGALIVVPAGGVRSQGFQP